MMFVPVIKVQGMVQGHVDWYVMDLDLLGTGEKKNQMMRKEQQKMGECCCFLL
jgi:hypothetical protein